MTNGLMLADGNVGYGSEDNGGDSSGVTKKIEIALPD